MGEENFVATAERRVAWLRIAAVGLIVAAQTLPHPNRNRSAFLVVAACVFAYAVGALVWAYFGTVSRRLSLAATALDVLAISVLAFLSGGAYSEARLTYFLIPISVAFRFGWKATLAASCIVVLSYDIEAATHPARHLQGAINFVAVQTGYLLWIGVAAALFSGLLDRRSRALVRLASGRRQLLAEVMNAEDRERRMLAESLHDHAIQNLLAVRQDLEEVVLTRSRPDLERAHAGLTGTLADLRGAIFELHPHVLDQAGLETAIKAVAERASRRGGFDVELDLDYPRRHPDEGLLLGAAREFLNNAARHARAAKVSVRLLEEGGATVLVTRDDGVGFDPSTIAHRVAEAHIGLLSQRERIEMLGGRLEITSSPGNGTTIAVTLPSR